MSDPSGARVPRHIRVGLPMLNLVPGGMGGTETYLRELTKGLATHEDLEVRAYVSRAAAGTVRGVPETVVESIRGGEATTSRLVAIGRAAASRRLRRQVRAGSDVVHYPFTVPVPAAGPRPHVVSLHDVQHLDMPDFFSRPERVYRRLAYDRAAQRADAVITVSDYCRDRIVQHLGVPEERVTVVHLAVAPEFGFSRGPRQAFVLYPARRWPHKNHDRLIAAMTRVRESRPDLRLVLTGGGEPLPDAPPWVEQRGLVSVAELAELYRSASCLVFPSLYEGFGLPPLEAMASGCPVAFSTAGALPEICHDAGIAFDPTDTEAMSRAIVEAIDSTDRLATLGLERARQFTWGRCVAAHAELYRSLAAT